jgi:hypothetical protein
MQDLWYLPDSRKPLLSQRARKPRDGLLGSSPASGIETLDALPGLLPAASILAHVRGIVVRVSLALSPRATKRTCQFCTYYWYTLYKTRLPIPPDCDIICTINAIRCPKHDPGLKAAKNGHRQNQVHERG